MARGLRGFNPGWALMVRHWSSTKAVHTTHSTGRDRLATDLTGLRSIMSPTLSTLRCRQALASPKAPWLALLGRDFRSVGRPPRTWRNSRTPNPPCIGLIFIYRGKHWGDHVDIKPCYTEGERGSMPDRARMLANVAYDMILTALKCEVPLTSGYLLQGDVWKSNGGGNPTRTMPMTSYAIPMPNWYLWFRMEGKEEWDRDPLAGGITKAIQRDGAFTKLLSTLPLSIPGAAVSPQEPTEPFREGVFERLIVPLFARALFPPKPLAEIDVQNVADRVALTFQEWCNRSSGRLRQPPA